MAQEKVTWQEAEAQYFLNFLENFKHENKDAERLPDGPWASACMELSDICESYGDELSKTTLARKDQIFEWVNSFPRLTADKVREEAELKSLMNNLADLKGEDLRAYYQAMSDEMQKEIDGDEQ